MAAATPLRQVPNLKRGTAFGGGGGSGSPGSPKSADPTLGVVIFVGSEVMLFAGLLSAFLISRASASFWPPPNQPRLPARSDRIQHCPSHREWLHNVESGALPAPA